MGGAANGAWDDESGPGRTYEIRVEGSIDPGWSDILQNMSIRVIRDAGRRPVSVLTGPLQDRAALASVIDLLLDRGYGLLSVQAL